MRENARLKPVGVFGDDEMAYQEIYTSDGLYMIDPEVVERIIHGSAFGYSLNQNKTLTPTKEGLGLPTVYHYELKFDRAKEDAAAAVAAYRREGFAKFVDKKQQVSYLPAGRDVEYMRERLADIEQAGRKARNELEAAQREVSKRSIQNIHAVAGRWETAHTIATFVRDGSADILMAGAVVASGGAAVALTAAGSIMKGVGKWEDTGSLGRGLATAAFTFVVAVIPGGKDAPKFLVFTKSKIEFMGKVADGLIDRKSLGDAVLSATVDTAVGAAFKKLPGGVVPNKALKDLIQQGGLEIAIPAKIGLTFVGETLAGTVRAKGLSQLKKLKNDTGNDGAPPARQLSSYVTVSDPVVADYAILGPDTSSAPRSWN